MSRKCLYTIRKNRTSEVYFKRISRLSKINQVSELCTEGDHDFSINLITCTTALVIQSPLNKSEMSIPFSPPPPPHASEEVQFDNELTRKIIKENQYKRLYSILIQCIP